MIGGFNKLHNLPPAILWSVLAVVIVVVGVGGFFLLNSYIYNEKQGGGTNTNQVAQINMNDWQTVTFQRFGHSFSMKFPQEYGFSETVDFEERDALLIAGGPLGITVSFFYNPDLPLKDWVEAHTLEWFHEDIGVIEPIVIDGQEAYIKKTSEPPGTYKYAFIQQDQRVYRIRVGAANNWYEPNEAYVDPIINSFSFVDKQQDDTQALQWNSTSDQKLGIEFKLPEGWLSVELIPFNDPNFFDQVYNQQTDGGFVLHQDVNEYNHPNMRGKITFMYSNQSSDDFINTYNTDNDKIAQITQPKEALRVGGKKASLIKASTNTGLSVGYIIFEEQIRKPFIIQFDPTDSVQQAIVSSISFIDDSTFSGTTPPSTLQSQEFIYATKSDYHVTVYQENIANGKKKVLFEYDEHSKADTSAGNTWENMMPGIALSGDGAIIGFTSVAGVKVYDVNDGSERYLISKIKDPPENSEAPAEWSLEHTKGIYSFSNPQWSAGGRYLSFSQGYYEGGTHGIIDVESLDYFTPLKDDGKPIGGGLRLSWSPMGDHYVVANSWGYATSGLFIPKDSELVQVRNLIDSEYASYGAAYSPKLDTITFVYKKNSRDELYTAGVIDIDSGQISEVFQASEIFQPTYSPDGKYVYFIFKDEKVLMRQYNVDLKSTNDFDILPIDFESWENPRWTEEGYLTLVGVSEFLDGRQMFMFDMESGHEIYKTPLRQWFTRFAGFIE